MGNTEATTNTTNPAGAPEKLQHSISTKFSLASLEKEAQDFILGGGQFTNGYLSRRAGTYLMYKKTADDLMKYAYKCPNCGFEGSNAEQMAKPYIIKCEKCGFEVFKQEKVKGAGKKGRKKKEAPNN